VRGRILRFNRGLAGGRGAAETTENFAQGINRGLKTGRRRRSARFLRLIAVFPQYFRGGLKIHALIDICKNVQLHQVGNNLIDFFPERMEGGKKVGFRARTPIKGKCFRFVAPNHFRAPSGYHVAATGLGGTVALRPRDQRQILAGGTPALLWALQLAGRRHCSAPVTWIFFKASAARSRTMPTGSCKDRMSAWIDSFASGPR